jgi:hypothetical protein
MTVCNQCCQLFDGINDICPECSWENERVDAAKYMDDGAEAEKAFDELQAQLDAESSKSQILMEALEYYANHESVIKEAYHSNDEKQITVVHTFINHVAREAIARVRGKNDPS